MKGCALLSLALVTIPFSALSAETPTDKTTAHQIGFRLGTVRHDPEYANIDVDDSSWGNVFGVDYTFLKSVGESRKFKWGINAGLDSISNSVAFYGSSVDLDYYSTRVGGVFAYALSQQVDIYGKLGLNYNYGDLGSQEISGVGVFEAVGMSYQSSNGAFSAIEGQFDSFSDDDYESPLNFSIIVRGGYTF